MATDCFQVLTQVYNGTYENITTYEPLGVFKPELSRWEIGLKASFYSLMWLISFLGNTCVIVIVAMNSNMRTKTNIFITNLAISDLTIVLGPMWVKPIQHLTSNWILGEALCKLWPSLTVISMTASVFTMTAIACDRFFAVVFPLKSRTTSRNVYAIIAVIWISSIVLGAPLYLASNIIRRDFSDYTTTDCQQTWMYYSCDLERRSVYIKVYWTIVCGVANWIPMLAMTIGYFCIAVIMWRRDQIVPNNGGRASVQHRSLKKVLRMLFVVLVSFMMCWVPDQFTKLFTIYKGPTHVMPTWYTDVKFVTILLTHLNSLCNPLIYGAMNETFRKGFAYVFCCWRRKFYYERYRRSMTSLMQINSASVSQNSSHRVRIPMENNSLIR